MPVKTRGPAQDVLYVGSWFTVELDNGIKGFFTDAGGLNIEMEVVEVTDATVKGDTRLRKRPGTPKYADITLKRPFTGDKKFWTWIKDIRDGKLQFRTGGAIVMFNMGGEEIGRWTF